MMNSLPGTQGVGVWFGFWSLGLGAVHPAPLVNLMWSLTHALNRVPIDSIRWLCQA